MTNPASDVRALPCPEWVAVGLGGAVGAAARWAVLAAAAGAGWGHALWVINLSGALVLGCGIGYAPMSRWKPLWATGFLGAWTTYSGLVVPAPGQSAVASEGLSGTVRAVAFMAAQVFAGLGCAAVGLRLGWRLRGRVDDGAASRRDNA